MDLLECSGCGGMVSNNTDFCSQCGDVIEKNSKSMRLRVVATIILLPLLGLAAFSINGGNFLPSLNQGDPNQPQTQMLRKGSKGAELSKSPILGHKVRALAIKHMRKNELIVDAAINQERDELSLLLIVAQGTSSAQAETLGTNFALNLKEQIASAAKVAEALKPEEIIKWSSYRILIGVYTPDQRRIAVASKTRDETELQW